MGGFRAPKHFDRLVQSGARRIGLAIHRAPPAEHRPVQFGVRLRERLRESGGIAQHPLGILHPALPPVSSAQASERPDAVSQEVIPERFPVDQSFDVVPRCLFAVAAQIGDYAAPVFAERDLVSWHGLSGLGGACLGVSFFR